MKIITCLLASLLLLLSAGAQWVPKLNSHPSASAAIYLDFDGETVQSLVWNYGNVLDCTPASLTPEQIGEVFNRVSEDFRPFDINITTDLETFLSAPPDQRMRVIITPTSFFAGVGGVSYTGSFTWGDDTPCFVFSNKLGPNNPKMIAECCSHEAGHTLGLAHQSKYDAGCALTATYNDGSGTGETGWAPIMGNSYYRNMSGWNNGPTPQGCSNLQDNLSIITTRNGFGYRADDFSNDAGSGAFQLPLSNLQLQGIIGTPGDRDAFRFSLQQNSNLHIGAVPFHIGNGLEGAGLDIELQLLNEQQELIGVYNPADQLSVLLDTVLNAGEYYLVVSGTGNSNASAYSSLGAYTLSGLFGVLPLCQVDFNGTLEGLQHSFHWRIQCNESLQAVILQNSADGTAFSDLQSLELQQSRFSWLPVRSAGSYYRLKVITRSGHISHSATLRLKLPEPAPDLRISTLTTNDIRVQSETDFQYLLSDLQGRRVLQGRAVAGTRWIPLSNQPAGTYILSVDACGFRQTVRVLKM